MAKTCQRCNGPAVATDRYCSACGAPLTGRIATDAAASDLPPLPGVPSAPAVAWRSGQEVAGRPLEVWIVIALLAVPILFLLRINKVLFDLAFATFDFSGLMGFGFFVVAVASLLIPAAFGAVGWLTYRGEPEAPLLGFVAAAVLILMFLYLIAKDGGGLDGQTVLAMLAAAGWSAALLTLPALRDWFAAGPGAALNRPIDVAVSTRVAYFVAVMAAFNGTAALLAMISLASSDFAPSGATAGRLFLSAIGLASAAAMLLFAISMLRDPSTAWRGRNLLTVASVLVVFAVLVSGGNNAQQNVLVVTLGIVSVIGLWARASTREYFDGLKP